MITGELKNKIDSLENILEKNKTPSAADDRVSGGRAGAGCTVGGAGRDHGMDPVGAPGGEKAAHGGVSGDCAKNLLPGRKAQFRRFHDRHGMEPGAESPVLAAAPGTSLP